MSTDIALLTQEIKRFGQDLADFKKEIKSSMDQNRVESKERHDNLNKKIDNHYVTRIEHVALEKRVEKIESGIWWVITSVGGTIIVGVISFFTFFERK